MKNERSSCSLTAPRSAAERQQRGTGLVLVPDKLRIARLDHAGRGDRRIERVAAGGHQGEVRRPIGAVPLEDELAHRLQLVLVDLLIENVEPVYCSGFSFRSRASFARAFASLEISLRRF